MIKGFIVILVENVLGLEMEILAQTKTEYTKQCVCLRPNHHMNNSVRYATIVEADSSDDY